MLHHDGRGQRDYMQIVMMKPSDTLCMLLAGGHYLRKKKALPCWKIYYNQHEHFKNIMIDARIKGYSLACYALLWY